MARLFGFTLLRNGVKYDYSFREALISLSGFTEKVFLALGESDDGTEKSVADLRFIHIISTTWDESLRKGGLILSQQTNVALNELKKVHGTFDNSWGIYLQCDEVFSEEDYELIKSDIEKADKDGCDAVTFRYFHFWKNHHQIAINKKWYPQEIRAVKLKTEIESWGDAQSFKNVKKIYHSDARVFHYGHVREEDSYKNKKADILRLYHSDDRLSKYKRREKRFDDQTETLQYLGRHPLIMRDRITRLGDVWDHPTKESLVLIGQKSSVSPEFLEQINVKEIEFHQSVLKGLCSRENALSLSQNMITTFLINNRIPFKMRSKLARQWPLETYLTLVLSSKGISIRPASL